MNLKFILLCSLLIAVMFGGFLFYLEYELVGRFKQDILDNFQILEKQSEISYFAFADALKTRAIDWSSDGYIRKMTEKILTSPEQNDINELNTYLREAKMPFDRSVIMIDVLDKNGIIIASSKDDRLGVDEKVEEEKWRAHRFNDTINSGFGEAFLTSIVREEDESPDPMIHLTARIFSEGSGAEKLKPLDAVLLVHFTNTEQLGNLLSGRGQLKKGARTDDALYRRYKTAEIYGVNDARLAMTPLRFVADSILKYKVDSLPVKMCFEKGEEVSAEYLNYAGEKVIGVSSCLLEDRVVLILEVKTEEILASSRKIRANFILIGLTLFTFSIAGIAVMSRRFFKVDN